MRRGPSRQSVSPAHDAAGGRNRLIAAGRLLPGQGDIRDVRPQLVRGDRSITAALMRLRGGDR